LKVPYPTPQQNQNVPELVADHEIEMAIVVHVRQGEPRGIIAGVDSLGAGEPTRWVAQEDLQPVQIQNGQVQPPVAVEITGANGGRRIEAGQRHRRSEAAAPQRRQQVQPVRAGVSYHQVGESAPGPVSGHDAGGGLQR
jgi:hypothetical protein